MTGIALPLSELPIHLLDSPHVARRTHDREGRREVQFHWWQSPKLLPVRWEGSLQLLPWGSTDPRSALPFGGWIGEEQVKAGTLTDASPVRVVIPAVMGYDAGTWFAINEGVRGVVITGRTGPIVWILTRPSTNYYRNMTEQQARMPVLVHQVI